MLRGIAKGNASNLANGSKYRLMITCSKGCFFTKTFPCAGMSKYQPDQDMYGDWKNSDLVELGKFV